MRYNVKQMIDKNYLGRNNFNIGFILFFLFFSGTNFAQTVGINEENYQTYLSEAIDSAIEYSNQWESKNAIKILEDALINTKSYAKKDSLLALTYYQLGLICYNDLSV